jgi:hypothetical protein
MLFEDEASFYRQPTAACVYAPQGSLQPRFKLSTRANGCVRAAAALNPVSGQSMHMMRSKFTASAVGVFYSSLGAQAPDAERVILVMDNWPVHHHERALRALQRDARLSIAWLPTYSPWLNPVEKLWKWVRQRRVHMHQLSHSIPDLRGLIDRTLKVAESMPQEMLRYTGMGKYKLYGT